jgi:hypothetical protein
MLLVWYLVSDVKRETYEWRERVVGNTVLRRMFATTKD